jgi:hypothetical protein
VRERQRSAEAERKATEASLVANKAAAAAEAAADAAGASKVKRQQAEDKARNLFAQATKAEEAKKEAEKNLVNDLQAVRKDLWPAARKRAADEVMERVKQQGELNAAQKITEELQAGLNATADAKERVEAESAERVRSSSYHTAFFLRSPHRRESYTMLALGGVLRLRVGAARRAM